MEPHKELGIAPIIAGVLIVVLVAFIFVVLPNMLQSNVNLQLGAGIFKAQVATSDSDRSKGLSGVTELGSDQALLMIFPNQDKWPVDVSNMKVSVDVVWLDGDKKVIYIVKNTTVNNPSEVFTPNSSAKYVVELPSGSVNSKAIGINTVAIFSN